MLEEINMLLSEAKPIRPGTIAYKHGQLSPELLSNYQQSIKFSLENNIYFIRNSNVNKTALIQDPKQYDREPLGKTNYHKYYIDYNPYWQEYPKRYNSLMFISLRNGFDMDSILGGI